MVSLPKSEPNRVSRARLCLLLASKKAYENVWPLSDRITPLSDKRSLNVSYELTETFLKRFIDSFSQIIHVRILIFWRLVLFLSLFGALLVALKCASFLEKRVDHSFLVLVERFLLFVLLISFLSLN